MTPDERKKGHSEEWCKIYDALIAKGEEEEKAAAIATSKAEFSDGKHTFDLNNVEIFAAGTWNKQEFKTVDLDNMVDNFGRLSDLRAPLKLGHADKQKIAQNEGLPALGYVSKLWREGEKLFANFREVPRQIYELIKRKAYGRFSVELIRNYNYRGNLYGNVLTAVALLGDELPAVQTLKDILDLYGEQTPALCFDSKGAETFSAYEHKEENTNMTELEQLKADLAARDKALAESEKEKTRLSEENKKFSQDAENSRKSALKAKIDAAIDKGIADFKIVPASRPFMVALAYKAAGLIENVFKFGETGKETELDFSDVAQVVTKMCEGTPKLANTQETSQKTEKTGTGEGENKDEVKEGTKTFSTGASLDKEIQKIIAEKKLTYAEAFEEAVSAMKPQEVN